MSDDDLRHLCKLGSIAVAMVRDEDFIEILRDGQSRSEAHNTANCLRIMADAFVALMDRQGMKPSFRLPVSPALESSHD